MLTSPSSATCSMRAGRISSSPDAEPRRSPTSARTRELATQVGDNFRLGRALLNLSAALGVTDPAAAAEAARTAAGHLRRAGARDYLATAVLNLHRALIELGDWDAAETELSQAMDSDGLADIEYLACHRGWLAALRGDAATAGTILAGLQDMRASEAPQDQTTLGLPRPSPPPPAAS